jgi:hypothetical protein
MTIVEWSLYSEFEVDKSLSGDASSGVPHAVLREFGNPTSYPVAIFSATVALGPQVNSCKYLKSGDPGRNRTDNIQLRRLTLYPIELRGLASVFDYNIMDAG